MWFGLTGAGHMTLRHKYSNQFVTKVENSKNLVYIWPLIGSSIKKEEKMLFLTEPWIMNILKKNPHSRFSSFRGIFTLLLNNFIILFSHWSARKHRKLNNFIIILAKRSLDLVGLLSVFLNDFITSTRLTLNYTVNFFLGIPDEDCENVCQFIINWNSTSLNLIFFYIRQNGILTIKTF